MAENRRWCRSVDEVQAVQVSRNGRISRPRDLRRLSARVAKNGTPCFLAPCGASRGDMGFRMSGG